MLKAYFDESGIDGSGRLTVISGFIAKDEVWKNFDMLWNAALKQELRDLSLPWFHMVECESGSKHFSTWQSKPELRRFAARTMAEAIVCAELTGFWASVDIENWNVFASPELRRLYPKPYHFCFDSCLKQMVRWVSEFSVGENVQVIFSEQKEYEAHSKEIYRDIRNAYSQGASMYPLSDLKYLPMQQCPALQAADLVVYSTNKLMTRDIYGEDTKERIYQTALDVLNANPSSFTGTHHDWFELE